MSHDFEELDYRQTPLGELILRRRRIRSLDDLEVFEVKLGDAFLMSSLFTTVEIALAEIGLAEAGPGPLDVVVGGLGLGYTAAAALAHHSVRSLLIVEAFEAVIEWHRRGMVPLGKQISSDPRSRFEHADFFEMFKPSAPIRNSPDPTGRFHAVLLDIDHSPSNLLHESHAAFYQPSGLRRLAEHLHPGGVFALWSDDPPDQDFMESLNAVFESLTAHVVPFENPLLGTQCASTVYVARTKPQSSRK